MPHTNEIIEKAEIAGQVTQYRVYCPQIALKRKAGQFVIVRVEEDGERIPLTIADADPEEGTITLVVQTVGATTHRMSQLKTSDALRDVVGPLGTPTHIENFGTVVCIGGGIGIAPLHPIAQALYRAGNHVISILGARTKDLVIMEDRMRRTSDELRICTDDGSYGTRGVVTDVLKELIASQGKPDMVVAVGPVVMMKFVSALTREHGIPTVVSLNPVMVDGTGMCGGCRVSVGGETKFACMDGPEFDGHLVDYDELLKRQSFYKAQEREALETLKKDARAEGGKT